MPKYVRRSGSVPDPLRELMRCPDPLAAMGMGEAYY